MQTTTKQSIISMMRENLRQQENILDMMASHLNQGKSIYSGEYIDANVKLKRCEENYSQMHEYMVASGFDLAYLRQMMYL